MRRMGREHMKGEKSGDERRERKGEEGRNGSVSLQKGRMLFITDACI